MSDVERITEQNQERTKWAEEARRKEAECRMRMKEEKEAAEKSARKSTLRLFLLLFCWFFMGVATGVGLLYKSIPFGCEKFVVCCILGVSFVMWGIYVLLEEQHG